MTFKTEETDAFLALFDSVKDQIRNFEGCQHLELWRQKGTPHIMFTFSIWAQDSNLEAYRNSALFTTTWEKTKMKFSGKPEAWSVEQLVSSDNNIFK
ncbi:MAG: antibiotic biosynthesis monooxygenase family protein [Bacteroidota bacterium]